MAVVHRLKACAAIAVLAMSAGCGAKKQGAYHSVTMEKVNGLFAQAMAENRAAAGSAANASSACSAYRRASDMLAQAARMMSDAPPPDADTAQSVGWATASETIRTQQERLARSIRQSCGT